MYNTYVKVSSRWVNKIPSYWQFLKIKEIFVKRKERNNPIVTDFILSLSARNGVTPYHERTERGGNKPKNDLTQYDVAHKNDLLINCMNIVAGSVGITKWKGAISPVYYALYPRSNRVNIRFAEYIFRLYSFQRSLIGLGKGIQMHESESGVLSTVRMRIPMSSLNNIELPLPPRLEQDHIVRYLDWKISMINKYIGAKKKQIELLKKQRQAVINETVRRGHGQKYRFRHLFTLIKGLNITKADLVDSGVPCVSYGEIHSRYGFAVNPDINALRCVEKKYLKTNLKSLMKYGDFVFADTSEDIAGSGNFTYLNSNTQAFAGYHTIIARPNKVMNYRYLAYFFDSLLFRKQIQQNVNGVKVYSITRSILNDTYIFLPSADEQLSIVALLDEQCERIDKLVGKFNEEIMLFTEYRTRLISDVVTGRVDVQGEKVPEFEMYDQKIIEKEDDE